MPLYEYICVICGDRVEVLARTMTRDLQPRCEKDNVYMAMALPSSFAIRGETVSKS